MNKFCRITLLAALIISVQGAKAAGSLLRITCEGADIGAEVQVDGKFKGECPVDIQLTEGAYKLRVVKAVDASHEGIFEQDIRMGDGVVKKVEAVLSSSLTAAGQKLEVERVAVERAEAAKREARNRAELDALLAIPRQQGADVGNGKSFRDCPDCPDMLLIPSGSFEMGSNYGSDGEEKPVHRVTIAKPFALGKTEVTQGQWRTIMGNNPSGFSGGLFTRGCGENCPVENVSWNDAQEYIRKLNDKTGKQYRLPSEAEWEYACRAGGQQKYCGSDDMGSVAWYGSNSGETPHPVATKRANAWGLVDMSGNVWEWVEDSYHDSYAGAPTDGSVWPGDGAKRVLRGGSWFSTPRFARSALRGTLGPASRSNDFGFRLARMLP